jgi:hypothetical protein
MRLRALYRPLSATMLGTLPTTSLAVMQEPCRKQHNWPCDIAGQGHIRINLADDNFPSRGALNISRAQLDFEYEPTVDIEQGFRTYYEWLDNSVYGSKNSITIYALKFWMPPMWCYDRASHGRQLHR